MLLVHGTFIHGEIFFTVLCLITTFQFDATLYISLNENWLFKVVHLDKHQIKSSFMEKGQNQICKHWRYIYEPIFATCSCTTQTRLPVAIRKSIDM